MPAGCCPCPEAELALISHSQAGCWAVITHGGQIRAGEGSPLPLSPVPRPYGKDVPQLNYWLTCETIMKKFQGRPHWAKVGLRAAAGMPGKAGLASHSQTHFLTLHLDVHSSR